MNELTQQNQQIAVFKNSELTASLTVALVDGEIWVVAGDLAKSLEYSETGMMLRLCDESAVLAELNKINNLAPATKWVNEGDAKHAVHWYLTNNYYKRPAHSTMKLRYLAAQSVKAPKVFCLSAMSLIVRNWLPADSLLKQDIEIRALNTLNLILKSFFY